MRLFLILCFAATAAWAEKNDSAPVAHSLFPGLPIFPNLPIEPHPPLHPPVFPGGHPPLHPPVFSPVKLGVCPATRPVFFPWFCGQSCLSDTECPFDQKCCWDGGCRRCISPLPYPDNGCRSYYFQDTSQCKTECNDDAKCGTGKCCRYGCNAVCVPFTAAPTTVAPTTPAPTTAAPTTPATPAPSTPAPSTPAPTTPAPTTPAPTTTTITSQPQPLCPPGPSVDLCKYRCRFPCFGPTCRHCVVNCQSSADCMPGMLCCQDSGCNMRCTPPYVSG